MALTRKSLKAMGLTDEQIDSIIEMHTDTVDALKKQRDAYKVDAEKLPSVSRELKEAKETLESLDKDAYKVKYEALKEEFETYKTEQTAKETKSAKESAYRELLKSAGVSEKRIESVLRVSDIDGIELVDGKIKDADKLTESIKEEWADFIPVKTEEGAKASNPPSNELKTFSREDIKKMSPAEINANFDAIKASLKGEN